MTPKERILFVIPAAGIGSRVELDPPKQFMAIDGRPIISHTVENFLRFRGAEKVIVIASPDRMECMQQIMDRIPALLSSDRIKVICGADSRHKSIYIGLQYLKNEGYEENQIVVIHDGVRPFVNYRNLNNVITAAEKYRAAGVAQNLVSTIISVDEEGMLKETLNRDAYKASEMPQAFELSVILEGYGKCPESVLMSGTECLDVVKTFANVTPKIIPIDVTDACKITYKKDLYTANHIAKARQAVGIQNGRMHKPLSSELIEQLKLKFQKVDINSNFNALRYTNYIIFHSVTLLEVIDADERSLMNCQFKALTVVNITCDGDSCINLQALQRSARAIADRNLEKNITSYYIVTDINCSESVVKKMSKLITSLICDANRYLSGEIILF